MPEVQAWQCDECQALGRSVEVEVHDYMTDGTTKTHRAYQPPEGWLYVSVQRIGDEPIPAVLFCSEKCMGYHFRPMRRRKADSNGQPEEDHAEA